jgi:restriction system protein
MIENNPSNVSSAFEMLLEEVEAEIDFVNGIGSKAFDGRDYDKAKEALGRAGVLTAFRDKVAGLRKEWKDIAAVGESQEDEETKVQRSKHRKLRRGARTPEAAYYKPILQELVEMGGRGRAADVLEKVEKRMKSVLNDVDYEQLSTNPDPRWRNAAQWARNTMVQDGLLKADSPRGVWEISDKGQAVLEESP